MSKKLLLLGLCFLMLSSPALAWWITPELKQEIAEKQKALESDYGNPFAHYDLAITYAYSNHIAEGWEQLKTIHEKFPYFAPMALDRYTAEVRYDPTNWKMRYRLAFALFFNGKKHAAIDQFKKIIEINPKEVFAYGYIALIYGEMEEVDNGIKYVKKGLAVDSNVAALHLLLSAAYYKKGESWAGFWEGSEAMRLKALGY
ncbi:MAG: hypothetical protein KKB81_02695 [Candidatus Margulisbacteria bacterium]|nr:hypothetical protein [Candidatus Margulisiibacteriota bacterium]MBU1022159.1 hypothetical protein [Candidatus Margulisiibacteriota bacterium]MBU1729402.1 hypothetical protein [Candidatus Margulisiibacteriota bacterium]MBU1955675.1 hypothetical protein [Candidatus Margulisiibacteriota bacterium]